MLITRLIDRRIMYSLQGPGLLYSNLAETDRLYYFSHLGGEELKLRVPTLKFPVFINNCKTE